MKNLKLGKKLAVSFAVVLCLLVLGTVVSVFNLMSFGTQIKTFYDGPFTVKGSANIINSNFEAMQKAVFRSMANMDQNITNEAINDAKLAADNIQTQLPIVKEHFLGDQQVVSRLESYLQELAPMREKVLELASDNKNTEAAEYMEMHNIPVIKKAQAELDTLIASGNQKGEELISQIQGAQVRAVIILVILGGMSIVISVFFGVYITRGITRPVKELERAAENLAKGNLGETKIDYASQDELGNLADNMRNVIDSLVSIIQDESFVLNEMANGNFNVELQADDKYVGDYENISTSLTNISAKLSDTLSQINQSADQVSSGSEQVSSGAQALSQGATEQASSVEELAATINEISQQIEQNAKSAGQANEKAGAVGDEIGESNKRMQNMLAAMSDISNSSNEIGKIIKTIEDIAFQTNILALNAAVEAARAGEAGKGFAVVADEVRNLASKSAEASKNTAALIEGSLNAVKNGTEIADATAKSLEIVVSGVHQVTAAIGQISSASIQQAESIRQVTQGIDQISSVVQTNSATAEESAASSEELSGQAQILKELIGQFKLKGGVVSGDALRYAQQPEYTSEPIRAESMRVSSVMDKY